MINHRRNLFAGRGINQFHLHADFADVDRVLGFALLACRRSIGIHTDQCGTEAEDEGTGTINDGKSVEYSLRQGSSKVIGCCRPGLLGELRTVSVGGEVNVHWVDDYRNVISQVLLRIGLRKRLDIPVYGGIGGELRVVLQKASVLLTGLDPLDPGRLRSGRAPDVASTTSTPMPAENSKWCFGVDIVPLADGDQLGFLFGCGGVTRSMLMTLKAFPRCCTGCSRCLSRSCW